MPEVSQYYRQQRLTPLSGVGNLSGADIAAATQGNRELAKVGNMVTEFGLEFMERKEKAEFHDQFNTAKTEYLTKFFNYEQELKTNADTETYMPGLESSQTSAYKFTNKRAANEFELWKANEDLTQKRRVFSVKNDRDIQNYTDNWNLGIKEATRRTANAVSEPDYQLELANGMDYYGLEYATDKDGEPILNKDGEPTIQLIEDWENPLLDSDEVRMAGYEAWKADADAKRKVVMEEQLKTGIEAKVFRIAADQGYEAAEEILSDPTTVAELIESGMDRKDVKSLLNDVGDRITRQKANDKIELEARQETQLDEINKLTFDEKDYNAAATAVEASDINEKEQRTLLSDIDRRANAAANGKTLANDRVEENRLYELSLDIWRGAVTKKGFNEELIKNQSKLDDAAYKRVATSAASTLKSSQAQSLNRANTEAMRQLVDFQSEDAFAKFISESIKGLKPDIAKAFEDNANETRQAQFRELSNFNAELREWIENNPDKTGKEFFVYSRGLENQYRTAKQSGTTVDKTRNAELLKELNELPQVKTIMMISPDGKRYRVPLDNVQKFIDNGYKGM